MISFRTMFIRIEDDEARLRLLPYLRERGYLAAAIDGGVSAWPLNSVSDRYDRRALLTLVQEWEGHKACNLRVE